MAERMPIGHDINLLCDAATWAVERRSRARVHTANIQRHVRVGFAKAQRLLLLMDSYGITEGYPARTVLVTREQLPGALAKLRDLAAKEAAMPRQPDPQWARMRAEMEEEPCGTCGARAGEHCVVIGTSRPVASFPHAARYEKRRIRIEERLADG